MVYFGCFIKQSKKLLYGILKSTWSHEKKMTDQESQEDELLALASIFDEHVFSRTQSVNNIGGHFAAHLDLPQPFCVQDNDVKKSYAVEYLPPIMLYFNLPSDYPSKSPPSYTLSCKWLTLSQLSQLCEKLDEIWEENKGDVILFHWTSFLKDESCDFLNLNSPLDLSHVVVSKTLKKQSSKVDKTCDISDSKTTNSNAIDKSDVNQCDKNAELSATGCSSTISGFDKNHVNYAHNNLAKGEQDLSDNIYDHRVVQDIATQKLLLPFIFEHNASHREFVFKTTLFACQVCFQERLGDICTRFTGCNHVFCKECMSAYFEVQIRDGNVKCLTCPNEKCDSQAHPSQVLELVDEELYSRYDRLLLQSSLDTMSDIVYCPRKGCNCAVMLDTECNMGSCDNCHYVFCVFCKLTYHGVSPCKLKPDTMLKLRKEYEGGTPAHKLFMEKRYGKQVIQRAIQETYTNEWLKEFSKKCPHCGTNIEKIDGCNKMTCTKCHSHFCWICNALLPRSNPYSHFNAVNAKCFNMLFHGVVQNYDDDDDDYY